MWTYVAEEFSPILVSSAFQPVRVQARGGDREQNSQRHCSGTLQACQNQLLVQHGRWSLCLHYVVVMWWGFTSPRLLAICIFCTSKTFKMKVNGFDLILILYLTGINPQHHSQCVRGAFYYSLLISSQHSAPLGMFRCWKIWHYILTPFF